MGWVKSGAQARAHAYFKYPGVLEKGRAGKRKKKESESEGRGRKLVTGMCGVRTPPSITSLVTLINTPLKPPYRPSALKPFCPRRMPLTRAPHNRVYKLIKRKAYIFGMRSCSRLPHR